MDESYDHPRWGIAFDWLAVDSTGGVAIFDSDGYGAVPSVLIPRAEQVDDAVDIVNTMPVTDESAKPVNPHKGNAYMLNALARGLYAYEWNIWHGPYQRLRLPRKPITVDELPVSARSVAQLVQISVPFSSTNTITTAMLP